MRRMAGSMVLLLAMVLTLGACGGPLPTHIAGYRLDTELPQGLPDQAPIYRVVEAPTPAAEWARHVAAALGFQGEPVAYSEDAGLPEWSWAGPLHSGEDLTVYGNIAFGSSDPPDGDTSADTLETVEEAVAAARAWLTARDLLPADCADDAQAWSYQTGPAESRLTRYRWRVCFRRRLDRLLVGNCMSLTLDKQGYITSLSYVRREIEISSQVPIKTVDEAWQELQTKGPAIFDPEGPTFPEYGIFTITEVALGYRGGTLGTMKVQKQFKPYYIFIGKAEIPKGGGEARVVAYVPAWK